MANVFLVRHGSFDGMRDRLLGRTDVCLNKQGRLETSRTAEACRRLGIGAVISSPRRHAQETAAIIATVAGCRVEIADEFDDVDYGAWTGKSFSDLVSDPEWCHFNDAGSDARIPGGETVEGLSARIRCGLDRIAQDDIGEVVVVTHAEIISGALLLAASSMWSVYEPEPASITPVRWSVTMPRVTLQLKTSDVPQPARRSA
jgi:ribonuclease H / adenosylcobalamin/alpha-ribazole phosphatase